MIGVYGDTVLEAIRISKRKIGTMQSLTLKPRCALTQILQMQGRTSNWRGRSGAGKEQK
jgi:hypothetical protein